MDKDLIQENVEAILKAIGEQPDRDGLKETPRRVAEMYSEIFSGLDVDPASVLDVQFEADHDEMVLLKDIYLASMCEHHLVPFVGKAHVAYIPNKTGCITGLSKIARLVDILSKRPQVQERLTTQIANTMQAALDPRGVLVVLEAEHFCMSMRGIRKPGSMTVTSAVRGLFRQNEATRAEAMGLIYH